MAPPNHVHMREAGTKLTSNRTLKLKKKIKCMQNALNKVPYIRPLMQPQFLFYIRSMFLVMSVHLSVCLSVGPPIYLELLNPFT